MTAYWITFEDGSKGCCEGSSAYDAILIAEKISGKKVSVPEGRGLYTPGVADKIAKYLPYPTSPVIWQFTHPIHGKTPTFCHFPEKCAGKGRCQSARACND